MKPQQNRDTPKGPDFIKPGHLSEAEIQEHIRDYSEMLEACGKLKQDARYLASKEWALQLESLILEINAALDMVENREHRPERFHREHLRIRIQDLALK